jgi:peptidylamidoglycolate lyase
MIRFVIICLIAAGFAQAEEILGQGEFRYRVVPDWGREALAQVNVKNGHAVAIDANGRLLFLTDDARNNVIILDRKTGALVKQWTARMPGAHGMSLVKEGEREVLFITDTQLHEVRKLTLDGEELAHFPWPEGAKLHASANEYRPSKTVHFPNGEFLVFDGYGKDYIFHYKADGSLLRWWGGNLGEGEDQLKHWGPHGGGIFGDGLVSDSAKTRVIIAMSDQQEIKRFTAEGKFVDKIPMPGGNPRDIVFWGEHILVPHLGDQWPKDKNAPGFISILDREYRVVSNIGAPAAVYEGGVLQPMRSDGKTFIHPHGVAVDGEGNLYVAQFASQAAPLLKLERVK